MVRPTDIMLSLTKMTQFSLSIEVPRNHNQMANGAQLQKLLVNGTSANITTANTVMTTTTNKITNEFPRLPGGAELNILPTGTNGTNLYRTNGKVIINNGFNIKGNKGFCVPLIRYRKCTNSPVFH